MDFTQDQPKTWELYSDGALVRGGLGPAEARDLVIMSASPSVLAFNREDETRVMCDDVRGESWPEDHGYGEPPEDWPGHSE